MKESHGGSPDELAKEFEPTAQSIRNWVAQAERDAGRRLNGLTSEERIVWMLPDSFAFFSGFWIVYPVADTRAWTRSGQSAAATHAPRPPQS